jgi:hypothetical protein
VINVDKNPAYPAAVEALKEEGVLLGRVRLRQCKYLNNVVEQDHRTVKKRVWLAKGYGSFITAWRTLQEIEAVHTIRKGRARWVAKGDAIAGRGGWRRETPSHKRVSFPRCSASLPNPNSVNTAARLFAGSI